MAYLTRSERRQSILKAAAAVVAREGLSSVTTRIVAEELDGSPGQIHHHFASTDELAAEAWHHYALAEIEVFRHEIVGLDSHAALALFFSDLLSNDSGGGAALSRWAEAGAHAQLRPLVGTRYLETLALLINVLTSVLSAEHADEREARSAAGRLLMLGVGLAGTTRVVGSPTISVYEVMKSAIEAETRPRDLSPAVYTPVDK